jgi:hypothetical protein
VNVSQLVAAARRNASIITLRGVKAQGARGYFEAIAYINGGNKGLSHHDLCDMAFEYLEITVDRQWQRRRYFEGAEAARGVVKRLQQ